MRRTEEKNEKIELRVLLLAALLLAAIFAPAAASSSISPYRGSFNVTLGKNLEIPMIVANLGDAEDQFTFKVSGTGAPYATLSDTSATIPAKSSKQIALSVFLPTSANQTEYYVEVVAKRAGAFSSSSGTGGAGVGIETSVSAVYKLFPAEGAASRAGFSLGSISPVFWVVLLFVISGAIVAVLLFKRF